MSRPVFRGPRMRACLGVLGLLPLAVGAGLLWEQGWLAVKAQLAASLIDRAFDAHLEDGRVHRPWRWADTHPIARLEVPRLGIRRHVLAGSSGSSLAFGPGHVDGTALPNRPGNSALAGHRDSWFAFLEQLRLGDELQVTTRDASQSYRVTELGVLSMWDTGALEPTADTRITLITCYPFEGLLRSPWRFVVVGQSLPAVPAAGGT